MVGHRKALICKRCHTTLSRPVAILCLGDENVVEPEFIDNQHVMEEGFAFESLIPYRKSAGISFAESRLEYVPQIWMTDRDLLETVGYTKISSRLNGCCGLDGCNGPNRICACGAEVGTEMSDCWTSFLFIPNPEETLWLELE